MKNISLFLLICLIPIYAVSAASPAKIPLADYLEFARSSADWVWDKQDSLVEAWRKKLDPRNIFGYQSPPRLLEMAAIYGFLYEFEGREEYAERAKSVLLTYDDHRKEFPEEAMKKRPDYSNGVPALPNFFTTMNYIKPYLILKEAGYLNQSEQKEIEEIIAHSIEYTLQTQEWGAMNRAILRAEALAWAIKAVPDNPRTKYWKMYENALGADNWGNWEIEDATIYHGVWLYALLGYADAKDTMPELFKLPEMYYYSHYFLHLMCPDGMIPDFGDSRWQDNWRNYLVFFEAAAKVYDNPELKWAASVIGNKFIDYNKVQNTNLALVLLDCYRYGADEIEIQQPNELSEEVMEDVVGKKIVFRNGWEANSSYMPLNYRDEGDGGLLFRDYLRNGIPVEEEKMTHGHADENSIVLLMYDGSVLLHDGGYRDYMPSGVFGAYRQDYFHNRLCVRPEKIWMGQKQGEYRYSPTDHPEIPGQSILDFMHNAGSYRKVRTQKIDFLTFSDFDYSRTRVIDDKMGYEWDRVVTYIKEPEMWVVFDILKAVEEEFFTAANLWHTRKIIDQGDHWYDTKYDSLRRIGLAPDNNLLIYFPSTHYRLESVENERRNTQEEYVISQYTGQHFELGQDIAFVTILIPHPAGENPQKLMKNIRCIESTPQGKGLCLEIVDDERIITIGAKRNLKMDLVRDYRRPKYTYESGKITYDKLETNGDFFYTCIDEDKLNLTVVNLSKVVFDNQVIFSQKPSLFGLAFDGSSDQSGIGKTRYWREEIQR